MADRPRVGPESDKSTLLAEITRQAKVIEVLMDRLERNAAHELRTEFEELQSAVVLRREVRRQTAELEVALRNNELMTRQLRLSEFKLLTVVDQPLVGIAMSEDGRFTFVNQKLADIFGYPAKALIGTCLQDLVADCDKARAFELLQHRLSGETLVVDSTLRGVRCDGLEIDVEVHGSLNSSGGKQVAVVVILDVSSRMQAERRAAELQSLLHEQSIRDPLTRLHNRRHLDAILAHDGGHDHSGVFSLVMCDIDHFKDVNDTYGHQVGDGVLLAVAELIARHCGPDDFAVRYGGEEFLIGLSGEHAATAAAWAGRVRAELERQNQYSNSKAFRVTASFGIATAWSAQDSWRDVLDAADRALYEAKRLGRNQVRCAGSARPAVMSAAIAVESELKAG